MKNRETFVKTKVVLTVDTEPSVAGAFRDEAHEPLIHEPVAGMVDGRSEGLGFLVETLSTHGLVATFFVETLHTRYFSDTVMGGYVEGLLRAGQDVQLHLHPCWLSFEDGKLLDRFNLASDHCHELETGHLAALIGEGADRIGAWTGARPSGMRTGNFSTGLSVFEAMRQAGLKHASNICLAVHRPPEPELAVSGGVHNFAGVRELPVTCFIDTGPVGRRTAAPDAGHRIDSPRADQPPQHGLRQGESGRGDRYPSVRVRKAAGFPIYQPSPQSNHPGAFPALMRVPVRKHRQI